MKLPESVEAEAAAWIAKLHNDERSAEDARSFQRWLGASTLHKTAFENMTNAWEAAGKLKSDVLSRQRLTPIRRNVERTALRWRPAALFAAVMVLFVGVAGKFWVDDSDIGTQTGERRDIALPDSSRMTLNTDTRVTVKYDAHRRVVQLERGEAFFHVAAMPGKPFVVKTRDREIIALGTAFSVRSEARKIEVTLIEGKVAIAARTGVPVILNPGQRLTLLDAQAPKLDEPIVEKVTAWRQGLVALDDIPLADAVAEMNRYSTVKLAIAPDVASTIRVSGIFHSGDSADFARGLAGSHGLKVTHHANTILLMSSAPRG